MRTVSAETAAYIKKLNMDGFSCLFSLALPVPPGLVEHQEPRGPAGRDGDHRRSSDNPWEVEGYVEHR